MTDTLKRRIQDDMKLAMKAGDKSRLGVIRLILAAVKQREVDERIELDDAQVLVVLDKMVKQRRESVSQYSAANRNDLAEVEQNEILIIQDYLPPALSAEEIEGMIATAVKDAAATTVGDMGKVMALLKPLLQGRADVGAVSAQVRAKLSGA
ncbi:GatB/YqeY domain-containing protein [Candidatus Methylospira mobilis]|uniref:GatB/YqeY domain-containing protein n=1 Tax=Candidatus Methylospira mobilis TaxID=1808979 RepID=A0A5Q0BLU3_9GAMM|nr:GatB/YqeY domain-containing protein [Candidatus Methylospira mobilis]QFY44803.1 GatB/YqeY domain-containing protein [Candidatus Methylospira mobilis]WNV05655.1 GatB/YqeY domain-containing protein [Candidatus Methylospira mobilis]